MGRKLRLQFPGALYHVTTRGNAGGAIFDDDFDRIALLELLGRTVERFDWLCLAYCLMSNHFHLVLETRKANLALGMRMLNGSYAQRFNLRHERTGHVFEGPYHAALIEKDTHMLEVSRYVVLNPVRGGLCVRPEDWPWSSYSATIGLEPSPIWLAADELLAHFGEPVDRARGQYRSFVNEHSAVLAMARDQVPVLGSTQL